MTRIQTPFYDRYVRYNDDVEEKQQDEDKDSAEVLASFDRMRKMVFEKHRHAVRDAHAKSHGILKGEMTVYDLPEALAQGVFRVPRTFPIIVRFSTAPGDILPDNISSFRGMAIKLLGVEGRKVLPKEADALTQDFLLVNHPVIPTGNVSSYLKGSRLIEKLTGQPEEVQMALSEIASAAGSVLRAVGFDPAGTPGGQAKPVTHILGETFFTMAALRHGDFIAKLQAVPMSENLQPLRGLHINPSSPSALGELVVDFFRKNAAEYEVRAQLCTDLKAMPIEDGSIRWPEEKSPYQPVARITLPQQEAFSPARRVYADDILSFNPWHCLPEHRPLGSIMRIRRAVYDASSHFRHEMNAQPRMEPLRIEEMPD